VIRGFALWRGRFDLTARLLRSIVCEGCVSAEDLERLLQSEGDLGDAILSDDLEPDSLPALTFIEATQVKLPGRPVWLSAGPPPDTKERPARRSCMLVRDAVAQLARACFEPDEGHDEPFPIVLGWEPTIAPIVLDAARRLGGAGTGPLVAVYISADRIPRESTNLSLADWTRGALVTTPATSKNPQARAEVMTGSGYRGVVFIGGGDDVSHDADAIGTTSRRMFAIASTGGAAEKLLGRRHSPYDGGGTIAHEVLREPGSYIALMRAIREAVR
jgi:hypothetical protein